MLHHGYIHLSRVTHALLSMAKKEQKKEEPKQPQQQRGVEKEKPKADGVDAKQAELARFSASCDFAAAEVARITKLVESMEKGELTDEVLDLCPEVAEAHAKVEKLKYRKNILTRAKEAQEAANKKAGVKACESGQQPAAKKAKGGDKKTDDKQKAGGAPPKAKKYDYVAVEDFGSSILGRLVHVYKTAVKKAFPDIDVDVALTEATNAKFGDYQCNSAMAISAKLKAAGQAMRPAEVGQKIDAAAEKCALIEKTEVAPAGFINIFLNHVYIIEQIGFIARNGVQLPRCTRKRVVVDFSSPNIAKEMHVGHLRSTIIGDSICRLFETVGFDVLRLNHIGDWGTQFGMLIAHLKDKFPDFLTNTPAIADLQTFYKESKKRFDEDAEFKARAYQCVVKLQSYDPDYVKGWQLICDVSRQYYNQVYDRLDVVLEERGESFYQSRMQAIVDGLKGKGVLREEEGRQVMFPKGCEVPLTVVKSDGGFTYDTSDLAALKQRLDEEKADWCIYVIDAGQSLHMETVFAAARDCSWYNEAVKRVEHVGFGLVLGEDKKKFKTRSGETVRLTDLLDEGVKRAAEKLIEKGRDKAMSEEELAAARDAVAYGCVKYADLSHTRTQDYVFSFDRMLDDRGNTAVYLLYAYARIRSIVRTSGVSAEELAKYVNDTHNMPLQHPAEVKLAKQVLKLADCVLQVLDTLMLHQMCDYVYQLSTQFHDFYNECYVIEKKDGVTQHIHMHRLALCEVTANVMATCFKILGIREVPKM